MSDRETSEPSSPPPDLLPQEPAATAAPAKERSNLGTIGKALAIAAGLLCLGWSLREVDAAAAIQAVVRAGPLLLLGALPYGFSLVADGWGFSRLLGCAGHRIHPFGIASTRASAEALAISLPGGALIAETLKPLLLASRFGVPVEEGAGGIAARKCLIIAGHGAYVGLAALLGWGWLSLQSQRLTSTDGLPWLVLATAVSLCAIAIAMRSAFVSGTLITRLSSFAARIPIAALRRRLSAAVPSVARADASLGRMLALRTGAASLPAFVLMWLCETFESWLLLRLFGYELGFAEVLALEATISAIRAFSFFAPAGIGFQDAGYLALLGAVGPGAGSAAAFVVAKRLREICWIAIGYVLLGMARRRPEALPGLTPLSVATRARRG